jgi:hypothetical protein
MPNMEKMTAYLISVGILGFGIWIVASAELGSVSLLVAQARSLSGWQASSTKSTTTDAPSAVCTLPRLGAARDDMKRPSEWIRTAAANSGHSDMVFAIVTVVVATLFVFVLRRLFG